MQWSRLQRIGSFGHLRQLQVAGDTSKEKIGLAVEGVAGKRSGSSKRAGMGGDGRRCSDILVGNIKI